MELSTDQKNVSTKAIFNGFLIKFHISNILKK